MARREVIGTVLAVDAPEAKRAWGWTPSGVEVAPDHLQIGDRAVQVREVAAWPSAIGPGSVSDVALVGEAVLVLSLAAVPAEQVRAAINRALPRQQSAAREAQRKGTVDAEQERRIQDALGLLDAIASGQVRHFDVRVSAVYWGDAAEAVRAAGTVAQRRGRERGMDLVALRHSQAQSYRGGLPGGRPVLRGLLLDQTQCAALFPFGDEDLLEDGGTLVGINERTGAPVLWNRWVPDVQHLLLTADTGFGKTFTVKTLTSQERVLGRPCLILDPSAKREYAGWVDAHGGVYLALEPAGSHHLNPLEILPPGDALASGKTPEETSGRPISDRIAAAKPILAALVGESLEQGAFDAVAEAAIQKVYRDAGFTDSWAGCFAARKDALGAMAWEPRGTCPVLSDVRRALETSEDPEGPRYARMLAPYCQGGSSDLLDGQTSIAINSPVIGLGVNALISVGGRFARAGYAAVIDFAAQRFRALPDPRKVIVVDEAHNFLKDEAMSRWLERQLREARRAGISMTLISQGIGDFLRSEAGRTIWQNSRARLYLHQPAGDLTEAAQVLGLDPAMLAEAAHLPTGHGVLQVGDRTVSVAIQAPAGLEHILRSDVAFTAAQEKGG